MINRLLVFLLIALPCSAQTWSTWNGKTVGSTTGNVSSMDGKTIGTSTGNYNKWDNLGAPSSGGSAPSVVQSISTGSSAAISGIVLTNPVTIGNILVVVMNWGPASATLTFTDTFFNAPTTLASATLATDDDVETIACAPITATGGADTVSFQVNGVSANVFAIVYEVANATCTQDVTAVHTNTTSATACSSGAMTTTTANDFLIAACSLDGTQTAAIAAGSGWSGALNAGNTGHPLLMGEYRVGTTPGSFTATSGTITSEEQATLLVALKP